MELAYPEWRAGWRSALDIWMRISYSFRYAGRGAIISPSPRPIRVSDFDRNHSTPQRQPVASVRDFLTGADKQEI
jgi:hypothetical protein